MVGNTLIEPLAATFIDVAPVELNTIFPEIEPVAAAVVLT